MSMKPLNSQKWAPVIIAWKMNKKTSQGADCRNDCHLPALFAARTVLLALRFGTLGGWEVAPGDTCTSCAGRVTLAHHMGNARTQNRASAGFRRAHIGQTSVARVI